MNPLTQFKNTTILPILIALTLACLALVPQARATCQDACLTNNNTVQGDNALVNNTGTDNTAIGFNVLELNTTGTNNTAIGSNALFSNTNGFHNTAIGDRALFSNTTSFDNTATGHSALFGNTTGDNNTAIGSRALWQNTTGRTNTAIGSTALLENTAGNNNTATGTGALTSNTTGSDNTATGDAALFGNTTGSNNIAVGAIAGFNLTRGNNNIDIGSPGVAGEANTIRIGVQGTQTATFIAGISGTPLGPGVAVGVNVNGQLGVRPSSARYKEAIQPMDNASEAIHALKPAKFRYKKELDPDGISQFGLVAEEVEKVNPDLVARDEQGKPYSVRYEAVNAMLLNEFLKEHRKVEKLEATVAQQQKDFQKEIQSLAGIVKEQASQIQKVSAQVEMSKPVSKVVLNNP
jgi:hypothetical protein